MLDAADGLTRGADGTLHLRGHDLAKLCADLRTPVHLLDGQRLTANVRAIGQASSIWPVSCELVCSYKTNPVPGALALMHAAGAGAEVVTEAELWLAQQLNVPADKLVFNGPVKSDSALRWCVEQSIACININSVGELQRLVALAERLQQPVNVGVRASVSAGWSGQFGIDPVSTEWGQAWSLIGQHPLLQPTGLHIHRGATLSSADAVAGHVHDCVAIWQSIHRDFDVALSILDLGGSLCSPRVHGIAPRADRLNRTLLMPLPEHAPGLGVEEYVQAIHAALADTAPDPQPQRVLLEPGRGVSGNTQHLLLRVVDLKPHPDGYTYAILDGGIDVAETLRSESHRILPVGPPPRGAERTYRLVGPVCSPGDVIRNAIRLPELAVGDVLAVLDTGAYFTSFAVQFTTPDPGVLLVEPDGTRWLRSPQSFADMFANDALGDPAGAAPTSQASDTQP